jgi:hypothetical protein
VSNSSGIPSRLVLEVARDAFGLSPHAARRTPRRWRAAAPASCSSVLAGAILVIACFGSASAISPGLSSGLWHGR